MTTITAARRIVVTEQDCERLQRLIERHARGRSARECEALDAELERAEIVGAAEVPADVVTMNSRVRFGDVGGVAQHEATLVYPGQADAAQGRISILAPVGAALLGLAVGETIDWPMPDGADRRLVVLDVTYQPERAGDFHL